MKGMQNNNMWKYLILSFVLLQLSWGIPVREDKHENSLLEESVVSSEKEAEENFDDYTSEEDLKFTEESLLKWDSKDYTKEKQESEEDYDSETLSDEDFNDNEDYEDDSSESEDGWLDTNDGWSEADEEWVAEYEDQTDLVLDEMDDFILDLMDRNRYDGISMGVVRDGKLIFADGYGDWGKKQLYASAVMPISSISRTLTAVAILQLVQRGELDLKSKVFGEGGILEAIKAVEGVPNDPRINEITVEHLLRHSAGWDDSKAPIFDPLLNELYIQRDEEVVDIKKALKVDGPLSQYNIISFMLSSPLQFEPGTRSKKSNFGYSILGRVVEEISFMPYEDYVKKFILVPAGMIHTRIGPRYSDEYQLSTEPGMFRSEINSNTIHSIVDPMLLDSALGWYSNAYDISRFMNSLLGYAPKQILSTEMVEFMLQRPQNPDPLNVDSWRGIGFHVKNDGSFWMDSDIHDNDVILYHKGPWGSPVHDSPMNTLRQGITVITLTTNNRFKKLKSAMSRIVDMVRDWPENMPDVSIEEELADLEIGPRIVRYQLAENHLLPYINALRSTGYAPTWLHAYTDEASTQFAIIAEKQENVEDFELLVEASKKRLFSHIAKYQAKGYYVDFLQSYESWSHDDRMTHIALMKQATQKVEPEKWAIGEDIETYFSELGTASGRGYTLLAQSIVSMRQGPHATYLMKKLDDPNKGRFMSFHDLNLQQLEDKTRENAARDYTLSYLDTYLVNNKPHFSAIYRQHGVMGKWILQTDITFDDFISQGEYWEDLGYMPQVVVGYEDSRGLRFATFWTK